MIAPVKCVYALIVSLCILAMLTMDPSKDEDNGLSNDASVDRWLARTQSRFTCSRRL